MHPFTVFTAATAYFVALTAAAPTGRRYAQRIMPRQSGYIQVYSGDGSLNDGWPDISQWLSFDDLWSANINNIEGSCSQFGVQDTSSDEAGEIQSAILNAAGTYGVDSRFILAIMMQESNGCVRVPTTGNGVTNPGLMQSHDGPGSCNNGGNIQTPCPDSEIVQMIDDGAGGTSSGDGLEQTLSEAPGRSGGQQYYQGAVIYNAGSLPADGNLDDSTATRCYASDVANRLLGWTQGNSGCTLTH